LAPVKKYEAPSKTGSSMLQNIKVGHCGLVGDVEELTVDYFFEGSLEVTAIWVIALISPSVWYWDAGRVE
jgi:lipid A disaccharide synthetase